VIVALASFVQLAAQCAPTVHVDTLAAVARAESRFETNAINDNSARRRYSPADRAAASAIAVRLIALGHSVDLGLMQVNSANLRGLGLSVADAFDPCRSIAAGARVLRDGYRAPGAGVDAQPALLRAISRYNTGDVQRGFGNGYVARVQVAAEQVVPAIRIVGGGSPSLAAPAMPAAPVVPQPPAWDVFARARAAKTRRVAPLRPPLPEAEPVRLEPVIPVGSDAR